MILVTGGFGYLGGRIVEHLVDRGIQVRVGTSRADVNIPEQLKNCDVAQINLLDTHSLELACKDVTSIIHLAGMNAQSCGKDPQKALMVNGLGTYNLLSSAIKKNVDRFLYISTIHVYGSPLHGVISESTLPRPLHPYSITNRLSEDFLLEADAKDQITGTVFRLSNVIGTPITKDANCWMLVANDLCKQVVTNKKMQLNSGRSVERDYIAMHDLCNVVEYYMSSNDGESSLRGEIINIAKGKSMSLDELTSLISQRAYLMFGYTPDIEFLGNEEMKSTPLVIENQKAKSLGFKIESDSSQEIDRLLRDCMKWYGCDSKSDI